MGIVMKIERSEYLKLKSENNALKAENEKLKKEVIKARSTPVIKTGEITKRKEDK